MILERPNRVVFFSDAPLEDFEGVTDRIDGFVFLAGEGLGGETDLAESELYFEVDLASIDTGIGLRNRHMRNNYLETDEFPFAAFQGRVGELVRDPAGGFRAVASGTLTIHGVDQEREVSCTVDRDSGELRVRCAFSVMLSDHDIKVPKLMFMKIDEEMRLELDLFLSESSVGERRAVVEEDSNGMKRGVVR